MGSALKASPLSFNNRMRAALEPSGRGIVSTCANKRCHAIKAASCAHVKATPRNKGKDEPRGAITTQLTRLGKQLTLFINSGSIRSNHANAVVATSGSRQMLAFKDQASLGGALKRRFSHSGSGAVPFFHIVFLEINV